MYSPFPEKVLGSGWPPAPVAAHSYLLGECPYHPTNQREAKQTERDCLASCQEEQDKGH